MSGEGSGGHTSRAASPSATATSDTSDTSDPTPASPAEQDGPPSGDATGNGTATTGAGNAGATTTSAQTTSVGGNGAVAAGTAPEPDGPPDAPAAPVDAGPGLDGPTTAVAADPARRGPTPGVGLDGPTTHVAAAPPSAPGGRRGPQRPHRPGGPGRPGPSGPPPGPRAPASGPLPVGGGPLPGTMIIDRYRLVAEVGRDRRADAALWKARDVMLDRDVAVTLLVGGWQADARASSALSRATRSAHFEHPHAARVLDVVRPGASRLPAGVLGAAVAEWTPGRDLAELVARGPLRPSVALRVVEPLAAAVAAAHRSGLVLGMDHPQRVRVSSRASARLAFPMPRAEATVSDDVHGLGAVMYLLLTGRWPTAGEGDAPAGLRSAPRVASGAAVPARQLRPDLPVELAALVDRTLDADGGIRTAAAVHRLVTQLREGLEDDGVLLPVVEDGQEIGDEPGAVWHDDDEPESAPDPERQRKLRIGVTVLLVATLAIVAFLAFQVVSLFSGGGSTAPPVVIPAETSAPAGAPAPSPVAPAPAPAPAAAGPVQLSSVAVYDPSGRPDNPTQVNRAVDGDPATVWSTSDYRQQFPGLKPGIGVMTTFSAPSTVSGVTVRSASPGTRVEIRSAPAADVPLSQTRVLGSGTVTSDQLRIPLQAAPATGNLLIWVTALGEDDGQFSSELSEVTVERGGG